MYLYCYTMFFFFNDTATTEIYTLSLHDALPIWRGRSNPATAFRVRLFPEPDGPDNTTCCCVHCSDTSNTKSWAAACRSEEHTSELQSQSNLVCRLLLEKKKKKKYVPYY